MVELSKLLLNMRKLLGECPECLKPSVFEVLNIYNQIKNKVLAECQCRKCLSHVYVAFIVTITDYNPIVSEGVEIEDTTPHQIPSANPNDNF